MKKKVEIHAVELVRQIRDGQAKLLEGKSDQEILEYFRKAAAATRRRGRSQSPDVANKRMQPSARGARRS